MVNKYSLLNSKQFGGRKIEAVEISDTILYNGNFDSSQGKSRSLESETYEKYTRCRKQMRISDKKSGKQKIQKKN